VSTKTASGSTAIFARRVVIATGHDGGGVWAVPDAKNGLVFPASGDVSPCSLE